MSKDMLNVLTKINKLIVVLSILICGVYAIFYAFLGNYFMAISSILVMFLPVLIYVVDRIFMEDIPISIKTPYILFVYASAVIGAIGGLYDIFPSYDKIIHFFSGVLISWAYIEAYLYYNKKYDIKMLIFNLICFNGLAAVMWEIIEFVFDLVFHMGAQKDLNDTMLDMIIALLGGILVALSFYAIDNDKKVTKQKSTAR